MHNQHNVLLAFRYLIMSQVLYILLRPHTNKLTSMNPSYSPTPPYQYDALISSAHSDELGSST